MNRGSPEWWRRVQASLDAALDQRADHRRSDARVPDAEESEIRVEVERILRAMHAVEDFLSGSAAEFAAPLVVEAADRTEARAIGRWFGRYRLDRVIGRGAMAVVYRAEDPERDREVALKVFASELGRPDEVARFLREIGLMATLRHPHILPILDSGELAGAPCFVMPLIAGGTLRQRLKRDGRLPLRLATAIARQVAAALAHAHGRGIVHRDIKPANILLAVPADAGTVSSADAVAVSSTDASAVAPIDAPASLAGPDECHALVADFGIARMVDETFTERLTFSGAPMGTLPYMSPEQARGDRDVDQRTDIYSLGCVLFEMLAGAPLYSLREAVSRLRRLPSAPSPASKLRASALPPAIERVLARTMAEAREERYPTAGELDAALVAISTE